MVIRFTNALPFYSTTSTLSFATLVRASLPLKATDPFVAIGIRLELHARDNGPQWCLSTALNGHGIGGSGITPLLLSTILDKAEAADALLLFAAGTAISVALLSSVFDLSRVRGAVGHKLEQGAPVLRTMRVVFGVWYAFGALGLVVYPL